MLVHPEWAPGLRSHRLLPPRVPLDPVSLRRSDNKNMELAESILDMYHDWPQSLRHVRTVSSERRLDCLSVSGSVSQSVGYLRSEEKALSSHIHEL